MNWLTAPSHSSFTSEHFPEGFWYTYSGHRPGSTTLWVWLHGWGHTHQNLIPLIQQFEEKDDHLAIDFPGFGHSPLPETVWGTEDYAIHLDPLIHRIKKTGQNVIFVGHSFGCRVSLRYVHHYPDGVQGMIFIAGAGLKRQLKPLQRLRRLLIKVGLNSAKKIDEFLPTHYAEWIRKRYGSSDYQNAGPLRPIFIKVISEDLTELAKTMSVPTLLLYGELDEQTPAEFGQRYHHLMTHSTLHILSGFDHYTVLTHAKYQVSQHIIDWCRTLPLTDRT